MLRHLLLTNPHPLVQLQSIARHQGSMASGNARPTVGNQPYSESHYSTQQQIHCYNRINAVTVNVEVNVICQVWLSWGKGDGEGCSRFPARA
jgi:hypothetical protein